MCEDVTAGLPDDLARLLRDPSILVPQDAAVFKLIAESMDAPSDTASALSVDEWREAWVYSTRRWRETDERLAATEKLVAVVRTWTYDHADYGLCPCSLCTALAALDAVTRSDPQGATPSSGSSVRDSTEGRQ